MNKNCSRVKHVLKNMCVFCCVAATMYISQILGVELRICAWKYCLSSESLNFVCYIPIAGDITISIFSPPRQARRVGYRTRNPFHGYLGDPDLPPLRLEAPLTEVKLPSRYPCFFTWQANVQNLRRHVRPPAKGGRTH